MFLLNLSGGWAWPIGEIILLHNCSPRGRVSGHLDANTPVGPIGAPPLNRDLGSQHVHLHRIQHHARPVLWMNSDMRRWDLYFPAQIVRLEDAHHTIPTAHVRSRGFRLGNDLGNPFHNCVSQRHRYRAMVDDTVAEVWA